MLGLGLLDEQIDDAAVRQQTFVQMPRARLLDAGAQVEALARPPDDNYYPELVERYQRVRRFFPTLCATVSFEGTLAGQPLLAAWRFLTDIEHQHHPDRQQAPLDIIPGAWRRLVLPRHEPGLDRRAYTLCMMAQNERTCHERQTGNFAV